MGISSFENVRTRGEKEGTILHMDLDFKRTEKGWKEKIECSYE